MAWRKLVDSGAQGTIGSRGDELSVVQHFPVPMQRHAQAPKCLDLRSDVTRALMKRVVKRLDAKSITGREQCACSFVDYGEGKFATELVKAAGTAVFEQVNGDLAVGFGQEPMPLALQLCANSFEVIEF